MGIPLDYDGFKKLYAKMDMLPAEVRKSGRKAFLAGALIVESSAKQNASRQFHGKGELAASIGHRTEEVSGLAVAFSVFTNKVYARIMEQGGTVEPKNVKWLTIPFEGVTGSALDYQETFFKWVEGQEGNRLILYQKQGEGKPKPLFVLVKKAEVPARPYMNPALTENVARIVNALNEWIKRGLTYVSNK